MKSEFSVTPKYSKIEYERKWLLPSNYSENLNGLAYKSIEDLYLSCGRLRLRRITDSVTGESQFKLCKKYGLLSESAEPIVNVYLTLNEYTDLSKLPGNWLKKRRYKQVFQAHEFNIDVFEGELDGLVICEIEAQTSEELQSIPKPQAFGEELTGQSNFSGGKLSQIHRHALKDLLNPLIRSGIIL